MYGASIGLYFVKLKMVLGFLFWVSSAYAVENKTTKINIPAPLDGTEKQYFYFRSLLKAALDATESQYGRAILYDEVIPMVQERQLQLLDSGKLNVMWSVTTPQREKDYLPIYESLVRGIFGYRVFLINRDEQATFSAISSLDQLKTLIAVQGTDWPDVTILRQNGLRVETDTYQNCFLLLLRNYVDYFPRGISEVNGELDLYSDKGLSIETKFAYYYPNLMYYFVAKDNMALAERIQQGLIQTRVNGTFKRLLDDYLQQTNVNNILSNRKIIRLNNDQMSEQSLKVALSITPIEPQTN